ncbi:MAG: hypothetical protein CFE31_13450 [Rhizobiales bacterium PAR1]|nr:MAG: hypothetical protein CFE31_13450 [Rhizobiales bacterium PAR1]
MRNRKKILSQSLLIDWQKIENFIGYGPINAPVVFVGIEEGASRDRDKLENELLARSNAPALAELNCPDFKTIKTWRVMCDFMLRREGQVNTDRDSRLHYQRNRLGKSSDDSLLTELLPYPSPGLDVWPYNELGRDANRETYLRRILPGRVELLKTVIASHRRECVICYGKGYAPLFKQLFPAALVWQRINTFELAKLDGQIIAIVPHFAGRSFNSESQMADFYRFMAAS